MMEYKNIKVQVVKQVLDWYGLDYMQMLDEVLAVKDWTKKEPFSHAWKAFATIASLCCCDEMREFMMNKRQVAIYFSLPLSKVELASSIAYHLKDDQSFTIVRNKVLTLIKEHNGRTYTSQSA